MADRLLRQARTLPHKLLPQPAAVLQVPGEARAPSASRAEEKEGEREGRGDVYKVDGALAGGGRARLPVKPSSSRSAVAVGLSSRGKATPGDERIDEKTKEGGWVPRQGDRHLDPEASQAGF